MQNISNQNLQLIASVLMGTVSFLLDKVPAFQNATARAKRVTVLLVCLVGAVIIIAFTRPIASWSADNLGQLAAVGFTVSQLVHLRWLNDKTDRQ